MIKTLIVDDDFLVRMFLRQITDWEKIGYQLIGDARDGEEALQLAEKESPELIITDISMPVMNGIELIRKLKQRGSKAKVVVLSCHDDFEYVKEAMKLGADEYILKNLLNESSLKELLLNFKTDIVKTQNTENLMKKVISVGSLELKKSYFKNIINGIQQNCSDALQAGIKENFVVNTVIVLKIDNFEKRIENLSLSEKNKFSEAFLQMCSQTYNDNENFETIPLSCEKYAVFCDLSKILGTYEKQQKIISVSSMLNVFAERYLDVKLKIGVSNINENGDGVLSYVQAEEALIHEFYENSSIFYSWQVPKIEKGIPEDVLKLSKTIIEKANARDFDNFSEDYNVFVDEIVLKKVNPLWVSQIIYDLDKILGVSDDKVLNIEKLKNRKKIYEDIIKSDADSIGLSAVNKAIEYIHKNYAKAISLTDLADYVHLNPAYLSYLFKQETGVNFVDALLECRMEKAKELLLKTDEKIKNIAFQVGFNDYRYFCKTFKKFASKRPQDFRNNR